MLKKIIFWLCLSFSHFTAAKSLALSFDDGLDPVLNSEARYINNQILSTLKQHKIHAILYPSVSKIGGKEAIDIVSVWGEQGHRIGNHGNLHLNLNRKEVDLADYLQDMQQGHNAFHQLQGFVPRYRFPFLKEGNTLEKREGVRQWLAQHQYQSGAVSIDASDWYYNQLFLKYQQVKDHKSLDQLKRAYIFHLLDRANYYDQLAFKNIGRSPKHMLLLHVRAINAAWLADIIHAFKQQGWTFIDSDSAYQDAIYQVQLNILPAGESIVWGIAHVYGIENLRYPAEDAVYEYANLNNFGLTINAD